MIIHATDDAERTEFDRYGATILRGVLSSREIEEVRGALGRAFLPLDRNPAGVAVTLPPSETLRVPEVIRAAFHPRIVAALRAILQPDYSVISDLSVQRNSFDFTPTRRNAKKLFGAIGPGWHHDAGGEGRSDYLFAMDFRRVKCGIYLQDNTVEWGGGIEVAPRGHKFPLRSSNNKINYVTRRAWQNLCVIGGRTVLDLAAGDVVVFDSWLPHRGNLPHGVMSRLTDEERRGAFARLPPDRTKLAIYYDAARATCAATYLPYSLARGQNEYRSLKEGKAREIFFADFPGLRFPDDYPSLFVDLVERNGLGVAQLDDNDLETAAALRRQAIACGLAVNCDPGAIVQFS